MDIFNELPEKERAYMERLFCNSTEEVRYYMTLQEVEAGKTFIKAGAKCSHIYIILSGKATGIEWPMHERPYSFKDYGAGDFFGEIECFADLPRYRISVVAATKCRVITIPAVLYMEWMRMDGDALYLRAKETTRRLVLQTAEARKYLFMEGRDRLMMHLCRKAEEKKPMPKEMILPQTRSKLAEEIGISTKTLERNIRKLEEAGYLRLVHGKIIMSEEGYRSMKEELDHSING